jgi:hypothetical protein
MKQDKKASPVGVVCNIRQTTLTTRFLERKWKRASSALKNQVLKEGIFAALTEFLSPNIALGSKLSLAHAIIVSRQGKCLSEICTIKKEQKEMKASSEY